MGLLSQQKISCVKNAFSSDPHFFAGSLTKTCFNCFTEFDYQFWEKERKKIGDPEPETAKEEESLEKICLFLTHFPTRKRN